MKNAHVVGSVSHLFIFMQQMSTCCRIISAVTLLDTLADAGRHHQTRLVCPQRSSSSACTAWESPAAAAMWAASNCSPLALLAAANRL
jgi:hypothetical protein